MTNARRLMLGFAAARTAFGIGLLAPPGFMAERWLGEDARRPGAQVAIRGLAARDIALAGGLADAVRRSAPVRPWLVATTACDLADMAATLLAGKALPAQARWGTVALAGVAAASGAALAALDER